MTSPCMPGSLYIILMCVHTERERGWTYSNNLYIHMYNTPLPTYLLYIYTYTSSYNTNPKILPRYNLAQQTSSTQLSSWPWTLQKRVRSSQVSCWFQVEQCSKPTSFRYTAWWIGISHSGLWYIVIIMNQQAFWRLLMSWRALNPPAFCALAPSAGVENPPLNLKVLIGKITELNSRFHCHVWFLEDIVNCVYNRTPFTEFQSKVVPLQCGCWPVANAFSWSLKLWADLTLGCHAGKWTVPLLDIMYPIPE